MPYKSKAQERFFHTAEARGDISKSTVDEFDSASRGKKLPEKKTMKSEKEYGDLHLGDRLKKAVDDKGKHREHGADGSHQTTGKESRRDNTGEVPDRSKK
jgi:hypothetical protein